MFPSGGTCFGLKCSSDASLISAGVLDHGPDVSPIASAGSSGSHGVRPAAEGGSMPPGRKRITRTGASHWSPCSDVVPIRGTYPTSDACQLLSEQAPHPTYASTTTGPAPSTPLPAPIIVQAAPPVSTAVSSAAIASMALQTSIAAGRSGGPITGAGNLYSTLTSSPRPSADILGSSILPAQCTAPTPRGTHPSIATTSNAVAPLERLDPFLYGFQRGRVASVREQPYYPCHGRECCAHAGTPGHGVSSYQPNALASSCSLPASHSRCCLNSDLASPAYPSCSSAPLRQ